MNRPLTSSVGQPAASRDRNVASQRHGRLCQEIALTEHTSANDHSLAM